MAEKPLDTAKASDAGNRVDSDPKIEMAQKNGLLSRVKSFWASLGLDIPTLITMAKGGIPPTIALSMYQSDAVASTYTTLGYLVAIISILGFAVMPRAKFIQTMISNLIAICLGAAIALLVVYCSVQARIHTVPTSPPSQANAPTPGAALAKYSSSASAVSAIWLFVQIYVINAARAKLPQLQFPSIMYSIFVIVACSYSPQFPNMTIGIAFVKRLLETFCTGLAIATGVSFVIFPVTCRTIVFKEFTSYLAALQGGLKAHQAYLHSLEDPEKFGKSLIADVQSKDTPTPEANSVKAAMGAIMAIHGKLQGDLPFAKREIAFGALGPDDLKKVNKLIREVMLPVVGLGGIMDIFDRIAAYHDWTEAHLKSGLDPVEQETRKKILEEWSENVKALHNPFAAIIEVMVEGLEHVALQMQWKKPPKSAKRRSESRSSASDDVEAKAEATKPGDKGFAEYLEQNIQAFYGGKEQTLREWCTRHGIELSQDFFNHPATASFAESSAVKEEDYEQHQLRQRQLYLLLFMEFILYSTSKAILQLVRFADETAESGKLSKKRLIMPGGKRLKKWLISMWMTDDGSKEDGQGMGDINQSATTVYMGQSYQVRKDPEHLPPANALEKVGNSIRAIPRFLRSPESAFGFRVAAATMSIAIVGFLHNTQLFFTENRLLWAMIMVAISMTPTAGQSLFSFILRILGTVVAMVLAFLVYYIPDGHIAGMIVFLWLFSSIGWYIPIKQPQFAIIGMISIVTTTLIIGYELEVRKIGKKAATSNGQLYLPIYLIAPYRLATVAGGLLVAFIWTIIPYPISEHSQLRQSLGGALYLLANYYSIIHETVQARIRGDEGDIEEKGSPGHRMAKYRLKVYSKQMLLLTSLKSYSNFVKWEIPIGGKFPKKQYDALIKSVERIINYISLIGFASHTFVDPNGEGATDWANDFRRMLGEVRGTSHEITSLLSLLSASITNGQPLPPYLKTPTPYGLSTKLEAIDRDILSVRHIAEPGYAAFAVMQVSSRCIIAELEKLLKNTKEVVGELDFSFHTVSTASNSSTSSETLASSNENKDKSD